jgi:hypothetical protein
MIRDESPVARSELWYGPFDRDVKIGDIVKNEVCKLLVLVLAEPADEGLLGKLFAELERSETVFCERVVKILGDCMNN